MLHEVREVLMAKLGTTLVNGAQMGSIDMYEEVYLIRQKKLADTLQARPSGNSDTVAAASPYGSSGVPVASAAEGDECDGGDATLADSSNPTAASRVVASITFSGPQSVWDSTLSLWGEDGTVDFKYSLAGEDGGTTLVDR